MKKDCSLNMNKTLSSLGKNTIFVSLLSAISFLLRFTNLITDMTEKPHKKLFCNSKCINPVTESAFVECLDACAENTKTSWLVQSSTEISFFGVLIFVFLMVCSWRYYKNTAFLLTGLTNILNDIVKRFSKVFGVSDYQSLLSYHQENKDEDCEKQDKKIKKRSFEIADDFVMDEILEKHEQKQQQNQKTKQYLINDDSNDDDTRITMESSFFEKLI